MKKLANEWLEMAFLDLSTAEVLLKEPLKTHPSIIVYHCHQSVEKIIKTFLIIEGKDIYKVHDFDELLPLLNTPLKYDPKELLYLNKLLAKLRYPSGDQITLEIALKCYAIAKKFYDQNNIS